MTDVDGGPSRVAVDRIGEANSADHDGDAELCPERSIPADTLAVHGLSAEFLADKPLFGAVADKFLAFVGEAPLVAHNAGFDIAFLNAEPKRALNAEPKRAAKPPIATERVVDTLLLARRKHTGSLPRRCSTS
jgi:DNA polymerase-3 subunit epsilon